MRKTIHLCISMNWYHFFYDAVGDPKNPGPAGCDEPLLRRTLGSRCRLSLGWRSVRSGYTGDARANARVCVVPDRTGVADGLRGSLGVVHRDRRDGVRHGRGGGCVRKRGQARRGAVPGSVPRVAPCCSSTAAAPSTNCPWPMGLAGRIRLQELHDGGNRAIVGGVLPLFDQARVRGQGGDLPRGRLRVKGIAAHQHQHRGPAAGHELA